MPGIRAQVVLPTRTNLPEDRVTNTLYFFNTSEGEFSVAAEVIGLILQEFYENLYTTPFVPANWLTMATAGWFVNFYDMAAPEPRVPYRVDMPNTGWSGANTTIPSEVCTCMSFHGAPINGQSQARRRGRIYLPGIIPVMLEQETAGAYPTFTDAWLTRINTEAEALQVACASAEVGWSVYSQVAGTYAPVVGGWVDEAPDTQRRRGQRSQERIVWTT